MKVKWIIGAIVTCFFCFESFAWNLEGHRAVAEIAWQQLTPHTKEKLIEILKVKPKNLHRSFLKASTWADEIKMHGDHRYDHWHYINLYFSEDGTVLPEGNHYEKENIVWALKQEINVLRHPLSNKKQKRFAVKMLIHLMGDIHQPLHCASRVTQLLPNGDKGGNLFILPNQKSLHQIWDSGDGLLTKRFTKKTKKFLLQKFFVQDEYNFDINQINFYAEESFSLAKKFAYRDFNHAREISEKQVVLAGLRLANWLNDLMLAE